MMRPLRPYFLRLCASVLCLTLVACGFQLRGHANLSPAFARVYINSVQPYGDFEQALRQNLHDNGVTLVESSKEASLIIQLASTKITQTSTGISADNQTREYVLTLSVSYQLLLQNGRIASTGTATSFRTYTASSNNMLANDSQADSLKNDIYNEAVFFMMNRLSSQETRQAIEHASTSIRHYEV